MDDVSPNLPLISVILPAYNSALYIADSIQSILKQSVEDFELIIIDDGSQDETLNIIRKFQSQDCRIRVYINENNNGLVYSLNKGISLSRGKWIARMDADDISLPDRFLKQIDALNIEGADVCGCWIQTFGVGPQRVVRYPFLHSDIGLGLMFETTFAHPTMLIRRTLLNQFLYDRNFLYAEDYELWVRLAMSEGVKLINLPEVQLLYRQHERQSSSVGADIQKKNVRRIRAQYLDFMCQKYKLSSSFANGLLKLRDANISESVRLDVIRQGVHQIFLRGSKNFNQQLLSYCLPLYIRAASINDGVRREWVLLCEAMGLQALKRDLILLSFVSLIKLRADSTLYKLLQDCFLRIRR